MNIYEIEGLRLYHVFFLERVMVGPIRTTVTLSGPGLSEASKETKHWRGKGLCVNNGLPLQCFVCSEPSDASAQGHHHSAQEKMIYVV